jgi:hypothetical protein
MTKSRIILLTLVLLSCGRLKTGECVFRPEVSSADLHVDFQQFEDSLTGIQSKRSLLTFLARQPVIRDQMLRRPEYPSDSVFVQEMFKRFSNPSIDTLLIECKNVFGDLSGLKEDFKNAFANIRYYYPDFSPPKVKTVITGLDSDMLVSDSLVAVSLDYYLGPKATYRPKTYDYLLRRYDPDDIVPSTMLIYGISDRFNKTDLRDRTTLAEMIAYGKSFYFAKHMLPCTPDSVLIWYTEEEIRGARQNEDLIWARLIQDKILFSTNMIDKKNYLGDRPVTSQVGEKCPGRIGQWIGWQIVNKYMEEHPDTSLPELMAMDNAGLLFKESHYKPKK